MRDEQPPTIREIAKKLDLFTDRARASLGHAEGEARSFNHNYLGTEHLLLGILDVEDGVGARVLSSLGVQPGAVRQEVATRIGEGDQRFNGERRLTPRALQVLELARDEARKLSHHYVGTEHLLLGLVREGEGVAAIILTNLGVDLGRARAEVIRVLNNLAKGAVITCRAWPRDLEAIDLLVEAGIRTTRSDAAAWLLHAGVEAHRELFEKVQTTVADIRRLRLQAQAIARDTRLGEIPSESPEPSGPGCGLDVHPVRPDRPDSPVGG